MLLYAAGGRDHVTRREMRHTEVVGLWRPTDVPPGGKTRVSRATAADQGASPHTSHAHKFVIKSTAMIRQSSLTRFIVNKKNNTGENTAGRETVNNRATLLRDKRNNELQHDPCIKKNNKVLYKLLPSTRFTLEFDCRIQ